MGDALRKVCIMRFADTLDRKFISRFKLTLDEMATEKTTRNDRAW